MLIKWKRNELYKLRIIDDICNKWETIGTIICIPEAMLEYANVLLNFTPVYEADILSALCSDGDKTPISTIQASSTDADKELSKLL